MTKERLIIGRMDKVDLPDWNSMNVPAKIDTGAYTSALHCENIEVINDEGVLRLSFKFAQADSPNLTTYTFTTREFEQKYIKSSMGDKELRYVITGRIKIFDKIYKTEFSLTDRKSMRFPILIGRKLLRKRFVVDVSKSNLSFKRKTSPNI